MVSTELLIEIGQILVFPGFLFIIFYALFAEWVDRKFFARLQNRIGPLHTGWKGILQPLADLVKLLAKGDITPEAADSVVFATMPLILFAIPLMVMFMVPIIGTKAYISFEGDLIVILFLFTLLVLSVFMAGWSSLNRFGIIGGMRASLQMLSYEIPMGVAVVGPAILAKSISLSGIVAWQGRSIGLFLENPTVFSLALGIAKASILALGFGVFTICMLAELEKVPFDIPEAETEIVGGWEVEYSGKKLALIRLGGDIKLVAASALMTSLFLGGPLGPWPIPPALWFLLKTIICVMIISNLRALFARYRIDQVMNGMWKNLVPLSFLYIIAIEMLAVVM